MLLIQGISKTYGSLRALDLVSFSALTGEIHAVLGENGAGKSTLMGVLSGFVMPDSGSVSLDGQALALGRPFEIKHMGIEMVHQHFMLVPAFTVKENLALCRLEGLYPWSRLRNTKTMPCQKPSEGPAGRIIRAREGANPPGRRKSRTLESEMGPRPSEGPTGRVIIAKGGANPPNRRESGTLVLRRQPSSGGLKACVTTRYKSQTNSDGKSTLTHSLAT